MYVLRLELRPTAGLTFRRVPFASTQMLTYPFAPAPTLSGYLERLRLLQSGGGLPETTVKDPPYIALTADYQVLGAYPTHGQYRVHRSARQGPHRLGHTAFSRVYRQEREQTENFQLYTWEYLFTERLTGWVVHADRAALEVLAAVENYGCKLGKEGYAYVAQASIEPLTAVQGGRPCVAVPAQAAGSAPATIYPVYRFHRQDGKIDGYEQLRLALEVDELPGVPGYSTAEGEFIPQSSLDQL